MVGGAKGLLLIIKNGLTNHENLPPPLVKELSTIVKSTHTFSIQGSVYEVFTVNLIDTVE